MWPVIQSPLSRGTGKNAAEQSVTAVAEPAFQSPLSRGTGKNRSAIRSALRSAISFNPL